MDESYFIKIIIKIRDIVSILTWFIVSPEPNRQTKIKLQNFNSIDNGTTKEKKNISTATTALKKIWKL